MTSTRHTTLSQKGLAVPPEVKNFIKTKNVEAISQIPDK